MVESKLKSFKEWLKFNFDLTNEDLATKDIYFQAMVHMTYTNYVEEWERGAMEETEYQEVD